MVNLAYPFLVIISNIIYHVKLKDLYKTKRKTFVLFINVLQGLYKRSNKVRPQKMMTEETVEKKYVLMASRFLVYFINPIIYIIFSVIYFTVNTSKCH